MTLLPKSVSDLSRSEKQALLPRVLLEEISGVRTAPASVEQERLWLLHRLQPDSPVYNLSRALRLRGALDAPALERALGEIVRRHEALRTTFAATETGEPVQVIAPYAGLVLAAEDVSGPDGAGCEAEARRRAAAEAARPFDLSSGPLIRATLLRLGRDDHMLLLCMPHVVGDGWSTGVLFRELAALYGAYLSLTFDVEADGFHVLLDYATDLFEPGTVERMARHLGRCWSRWRQIPTYGSLCWS